MSEPIYVPILKTKQGEFTALRHTLPPERDRLLPLFEITPVRIDSKTRKPASTPAQHVARIARSMKRDWATGRCLVDPVRLSLSGPTIAEAHLLVDQMLADQGITAVPVARCGLRTDELNAVRSIIGTRQRGLGIRVEGESLWDFEGTADYLKDLCRSIGVSAQQVDLVLDLGMILKGQTGVLGLMLTTLLNRFASAGDWNTITLCAGSLPAQTGTPGELVKLPRVEWGLYESLSSPAKRPWRMPLFGDYGITNADPAVIEFRKGMQIAAKLRYTTTRDWLIAKGRSIKAQGSGQFQVLASKIVEHEEFCGAEFSWGDSELSKCAAGSLKPADQKAVVPWGTNHHLAFVLHQLSNFP